MPYALFSNAVKVSKHFPSKADVWAYATQGGLVSQVNSAEEDPPRRMLDMGFTIQECGPDLIDMAGMAGNNVSEADLALLIAARRISPPSAAAAS